MGASGLPWLYEEGQATVLDGDAPADGLQPAASLILVREGAEAPEVLMLQRSSGMAFAPGALVFPGGRVDAGDRVLAADLAGDKQIADVAARIAAIRETLEESGLPVGLYPMPDPVMAAHMCAALCRGDSFGHVLRAHGVRIDLSALHPYARWQPGKVERSMISRIFDAWMYVARLADPACEVMVDQQEITAYRWATAAQVLQDVEQGAAQAIFPTRRILERIATATDFASLVCSIGDDPFEPIIPWTEERAGEAHLCIPENRGYPVTAEPWSRVMAELQRVPDV